MFYTSLGFEKYTSVDLSKRNNAHHIFDLNESHISDTIKDKYNLFIDAGTMEHVFDIKQVFVNISELFKSNGFIIHSMPDNNIFDHGFYQFSPTLFNDYYRANSFDILSIKVLELTENKYLAPEASFVERWTTSKVFEYDPVLFCKNSFGQLSNSLYFTFACVRKNRHSNIGRNPQQHLFAEKKTQLLLPW